MKMYSPSITKSFYSLFRLKSEAAPEMASEEVIMNVPYRPAAVVLAVTATPVPLTPGRRFFITSVVYSGSKVVTDTCASSSLDITPAETGVLLSLISIRTVTLTAGEQHLSVSYPSPIECKEGSSMVITNSGTITNYAVRVTGYYED